MPAAAIFPCSCLARSASASAITCTTNLPSALDDSFTAGLAFFVSGLAGAFTAALAGAGLVSSVSAFSAGLGASGFAASFGASLGASLFGTAGASLAGSLGTAGAALGAGDVSGALGGTGTTLEVNAPELVEGIWTLISWSVVLGSESSTIGSTTMMAITSTIAPIRRRRARRLS